MLIAEKHKMQIPYMLPELTHIKQSTNDSPAPSTAEPNHLPP